MITKDTCPHARGDHIQEMAYWLCCDCWTKLPERPTRYGMSSEGKVVGPRQAITWQAATASAAGGVTLNDFLRTMTRRFRRYDKTPTLSAFYDLAIAALESLGDPYGDISYDWTHAGARDLADEEVHMWDGDPEGNL